MGGKSHLNMQSDRPESGGANKDDIREKSGILEREKEEFAAKDAERRRAKPAPNDESGETGSGEGQSGRSTERDGYGGSGEPETRTFND